MLRCFGSTLYHNKGIQKNDIGIMPAPILSYICVYTYVYIYIYMYSFMFICISLEISLSAPIVNSYIHPCVIIVNVSGTPKPCTKAKTKAAILGLGFRV